MSRRAKEEYQRHYSVTEPRSHPKGYTEYKVTAKFVSRVNPEDVKEIVVWRRYSDFKKLHGDLAYTHRNLFRRLEDFPSFPKAQVFGRFEPEVIEERRKAAEAMLRFTVHIPALNNSPQLKEFFRGGEGQRPLEKYDLPSLPPPLVPVPPSEGVEPGEDALRSVDEQGPPLHSEQRSCRVAEAASEECGDWEPKPKEEEPGAPCPSHEEDLAALPASGHRAAPGAGAGQVAKEGASVSDPGAYLPLATEHIRQALEGEAAKDYQGAFCSYRSGVDLLLQGLQVDPDAARREAVKKKTAEYLQRAEEIFQQHLKHLNL
ncbi:sorting nexin-15 isoform X5 [Rhineura floridana]|uniref:sorting nexin-15 isoform X5 n=1 Tax=Rhineura floridana TaxID=261503 RepID=UPI002AC84BE8|nr:sorting nexin-15 isoform X5 [Rhineura floridana]